MGSDRVCTQSFDIGHPQNIVLGLSTKVQAAVKKVASLSAEQIVLIRGQWFAQYVAEAKELETENRKTLRTIAPRNEGSYEDKTFGTYAQDTGGSWTPWCADR